MLMRLHHGLRRPRQGGPRQGGFTIAELVVACTLLVTLAAVAFPLVRHSGRRHKEIELRFALNKMRRAIDEYKRYSDAGLIEREELISIREDLITSGYPPTLEALTELIQLVGQGPELQVRFLGSIPVDPMTREAEWELLCYEDDWDSTYWCGENVYDVYSKSSAVGLNGIPYSEW